MKPCKDGSITLGDEQEAKTKESKTKVATVNVLEIIDGTPSQIVSFKDSKRGNKDAELLFGKIAKKNGAYSPDIDSHIEDGVYTYAAYTGNCGVYLIHS